jgi:predicted DNA-binding transcriptional regulator AlpA
MTPIDADHDQQEAQRLMQNISIRTVSDGTTYESRPISGPDLRAANDPAETLVLTRRGAAKMCGVSLPTFDTWVRKGILPKPIHGTRRWSRLAVERALAGVSAAASPDSAQSPYELWRRANAN